MRANVIGLAGALFLGLSVPLPAQEIDQLREANRAASVLVLERLKIRNPNAWRRLHRCPSQAILLVDGHHDHTNLVLGPLGLRYRRCRAAAFAHHPLHGVRLVIIDCPGTIGPEGARRARDFVARGGTLLTTDWAVRHVLQESFGRRLEHNGVQTRDDVVRIDRITPHRLTRGVFPRLRPAAWWLENRSYPVDCLSNDVVVLFGSGELARRYRSGVLACTFPHGRGRVVHVVSHLYLQRNVHTEPWELRPALAEAPELDLPTGSDGYRRLARSGVLGRIKAGDLNATLSVQQFLLNIVVYALERVDPVPPRPVPPPPAPRTLSHEAAADTHLCRTPGGHGYLRIVKGLGLEVVRRTDEWVLVRTPAGQEGWLPAADVGPRRQR